MGRKIPILLIVGMTLGTLFAATAAVQAANVSFTLYGSNTSPNIGWGFTSHSETMPGPTLTVNQNDIVTMTLNSDDGLPHQFWIDYNGNGIVDAGEPESPLFTSTTTFTFTATLVGTFTYHCVVHPTMMFGTWTTNAAAAVHDIAVTGVTASPTSVVEGNPVTVSVTVANLGTVTDSTTVTAFANGVPVAAPQTVAILAGGSTTLTFTWNTAGFTPGSYLISAQASPPTGDINPANNQFTDGTVTVTAPPPGNLVAVLAGKSAWPLRHHFVISKAGNVQTFFAKVENVGPGAVMAKVVFTISDSLGNVVGTVTSNTVTIPVGGTAFPTATWSVSPGKYHVVAQCWFSTRGDGTFDGSDPGVKSFSFAVVP